jgi:predicted metal-dependent TIM-barrel fold hydrolase
MSIDQMKIAAEKGAYLELCCLDFSEPEVIWNEFLQIIREVGADHIIIASDCGNSQFPPPAVQYKTFILRLLMSGVPDEDVEKMAKINPRKLVFD